MLSRRPQRDALALVNMDMLGGLIALYGQFSSPEGIVWLCFASIMLLLGFVAVSIRASDSTQRSWSAKRKDKRVGDPAQSCVDHSSPRQRHAGI